MTARGVGIFTIEFADPHTTETPSDEFLTLPNDVSWQYPITTNIQTLSAKNNGGDPFGILYVPDLRTEECRRNEEESAHVPRNATRLRHLPPDTNYSLVAIAPWFSPACMQEYFESARQDPVQAFLVFLPGQSAEMPPLMNDARWALGDGGAWKSANDFPTYAIMSVSGNITMGQLSLYSGNVSEVPHGDAIAALNNPLFQPTDCVRLWARIKTDSNNTLPSLWVFLIIVLGLLILVVGATSAFMHILQRRRREDLRQRVINGEVNLEAVGVKRLTVPREFLEKLPVYTYSGLRDEHTEKEILQPPPQAHAVPPATTDPVTGMRSKPLLRRSSAPPPPAQPVGPTSAFSQPTCPICLDDFEPNQTQVRELPCRHIFHPDCIDTFLLGNSSLCPMCKESVLPSGYCPTRITNVMVRRERILRRMRAQSATNGGTTHRSAPPHRAVPGPFGSLGTRIGGAIASRRVFSAPERTQQRPRDIEMAVPDGSPPLTDSNPSGSTAQARSTANPAARNNSTCLGTSPGNRNDWARERALTLLGNRHVPANDDEEESSGPRWKRGLRKIFPGFR